MTHLKSGSVYFIFTYREADTLEVELRRADTFFATAKNIVQLFAGRGGAIPAEGGDEARGNAEQFPHQVLLLHELH